MKGDTPTNDIRKRLVYERYGALHAQEHSCVAMREYLKYFRRQSRKLTEAEALAIPRKKAKAAPLSQLDTSAEGEDSASYQRHVHKFMKADAKKRNTNQPSSCS